MKRLVWIFVGGLVPVAVAITGCSDPGADRSPGEVADGTGGTGAASTGADYSASLGCQKLFAATCARKTACGAYANSPNICLSYNTCAYDAYRWGQDCERRAAAESFSRAVLDDCEASLRAAPCDAVCGGEPPSACTDVSILTEDLLNTWFPSCDPECVP